MSPPQLSFQLYSSRNFPPVERQLATLAGLGYRNVELYDGLLGDVAGLKKALDENALAAPSGHFGLDLLERNLSAAIDAARRLGVSLIVSPYLGPEQRPKDGAGWAAFGQRLAQLAAKVRTEGLRFAWHNHDYEFQPLPDGSHPIEAIMADQIIELEIDVAWVVRAGADPASWLDRFAGRIAACHVKDLAPPGQNKSEDGWADVGHGTIDWTVLWPRVVKAGATLMIAEHDNPSDFERFARNAIEAMQRYARH